MKRGVAYTYTVLRYVHDTTSGEFVNVGVALYAPEMRYASAICTERYARLKRLFPDASGDHFRSLMRHIQSRFEEMGERMAGELPLTSAKSVLDLAQQILPRDDSSLQWSPMGGGMTADPSQALNSLYERMVIRYEQQPQTPHRTDAEVWRRFKRDLEERRLLHFFRPKKIAVADDEVEFQYAWKNGVWHCLEPISFDLSDAENIRDKAHRWLGQIASVKGAEEFKLYLLVGSPQQAQLHAAFESALSILHKMPVPTEIFREDQAPKLAETIAEEMTEYSANHGAAPV